MYKYYVSIKVEGEEGFFHLTVYADNESQAAEYGLNMHLNNWSMHRGISKVVRAAKAEG